MPDDDHPLDPASAQPGGVEISIVPLGTLRPQEHNYRQHNPYNLQLIEDSLGEVGALRSLVAGPDGKVQAGSGTLEAAGNAGFEEAIIVKTDGTRLVVVQRDDLTPDQWERYSILDNRATDTSSFEEAALAALLRTRPQIAAGLFSTGEQTGILERAALAARMLGTDPIPQGEGGDGYREAPGEVVRRTALGDVWLIGDHRLVVGDCTDPGVLDQALAGQAAALLWADGPYGQQYQSNMRTATPQFAQIQGDDTPLTDFVPLCTAIPVWYICQRWRECRPMWAAIEAAGYHVVNWIVWYKRRGGMGDLDAAYKPCHETIFYASRERVPFVLDTRPDDVWEIDPDSPGAYLHPTQKPIGLPARPIEQHTRPGDVVLDLCAGGGPALIAAHRLGRIWVGVEIDPQWADVILDRAEAEGIGPIERESHE